MRKIIKVLSIILPIIIFIFIAITVQLHLTSHVDLWAYNKSVARMSPTLTNFMKIITNFGNVTIVLSLCFLLFLFPFTKKRYAIPVATSVFMSTLLTLTLKNIFARERPSILMLIKETNYSFPSGHAMISMALYGIIILLTLKHVKNKHLKISIIVLCSIMPILIGISRLYLGVHYITDIIGGWCLGLVIAVLIYSLWKYTFIDRDCED